MLITLHLYYDLCCLNMLMDECEKEFIIFKNLNIWYSLLFTVKSIDILKILMFFVCARFRLFIYEQLFGSG